METHIVTVTDMHMPVWLCMHTHTCLHCDIVTCIHIRTHTHTHTHTFARTCTHTHTLTNMQACMRTHSHRHCHGHSCVTVHAYTHTEKLFQVILEECERRSPHWPGSFLQNVQTFCAPNFSLLVVSTYFHRMDTRPVLLWWCLLRNDAHFWLLQTNGHDVH